MTCNNCAECGEVLGGLMVGSAKGWLCERCHYIANPFQPYRSFSEVLGQGDDQVIVRQLLKELVPHDVKCKIAAKFNERMEMKYRTRCNELGINFARMKA